VDQVDSPSDLYATLMDILVTLARDGLIHGDFNEFNILIEEKFDEDGERVQLIPTIIDFPQMVSIDHANAEYYFDRDVACIKRFFDRRFGFTSDEPGPYFKDAIKNVHKRLDVEVEASGFSKKMAKELDVYMKEHGIDGDAGGLDQDREDDHDVEDDEEPDMDGEEEVGGVSLEGDDVKESVSATEDAPSAPQKPSALASQMTLLDIRDNDPLPDLSECKPRPQSTMTTKSAKKKAGWAI